MKKLLMVSKGEHFASRLLRTLAFLLVGTGLGLAFWTATMPLANAQTDQVSINFTRALQAEMPKGKTMKSANKNELLAAVCAAVKKNKGAASQIGRVAAEARKELTKDIMRTLFRCVKSGRDDCALLGDIYNNLIAADPDNASALNALALELAPGCAGSFQGTGTGTDEGTFGNAASNQNPPPGSIGGGGGSQGGRCQVCHVTGNGKRMTLTISCNAVPAHLRHGDTEGPCPVTPTQNP